MIKNNINKFFSALNASKREILILEKINNHHFEQAHKHMVQEAFETKQFQFKIR